jgi:hypothetical protein
MRATWWCCCFSAVIGGCRGPQTKRTAVLLGITKAPLYEDDEPVTRNMVRSLLTQANTPTAQILASRSFLFDPLDSMIWISLMRCARKTLYWSRLLP